MTGTDVRLNQVKVDITDGRGELLGLTIANPQGFSKDSLLSLGRIVLQIDPKSVTGPVKVINEVTISDIHLLAELKGLTENNLQTLQKQIESNVGTGQGQSAPSDSQASDSEEVLLAVESFTFSDSSLRLLSDEWGEREIKIPAIKLKNLGTKEQGLTPAQLAEAAVEPLLKQARRAVEDELKSLAQDEVEDKLKEKLEERLDDSQKQTVEDLKSLFGR